MSALFGSFIVDEAELLKHILLNLHRYVKNRTEFYLLRSSRKSRRP